MAISKVTDLRLLKGLQMCTTSNDVVVFQVLCIYMSKVFCSFIPELVLFFCRLPIFIKCSFMTRYLYNEFAVFFVSMKFKLTLLL